MISRARELSEGRKRQKSGEGYASCPSKSPERVHIFCVLAPPLSYNPDDAQFEDGNVMALESEDGIMIDDTRAGVPKPLLPLIMLVRDRERPRSTASVFSSVLRAVRPPAKLTVSFPNVGQ